MGGEFAHSRQTVSRRLKFIIGEMTTADGLTGLPPCCDLSGSMEPHEHEARLILGNALLELDSTAGRKGHKAAAEKLADELVALSKAQGLQAGKLANSPSVRYVEIGPRTVYVDVSDSGQLYLEQLILGQSTGKSAPLQLEYDCVEERFVGLASADVAPTPGKRIAKEHGVVVLARAVSELLTKK